MVRVDGHWRNRSWVRAHYRHPLRPGEGQTVLWSARSVVRIVLPGGPFPAEPRLPSGGAAVPRPRPPS